LAPPDVQVDGQEDDVAEETIQPKARRTELDENLVTLLSEAMDSEEEMELTPELLAKYIPEEPILPESPEDTAVSQEYAVLQQTEEPLATLTTSYRPNNRQDTDWLVILLIISFFILTTAAIITIVLLLV
jgi:hypothetical protein